MGGGGWRAEGAYSCADRAEVASLFAGVVEYGSFVREMQQRCEEAGVPLGDDCSNLVDLASQLSPEGLQFVPFRGCLCAYIHAKVSKFNFS